MCTAASCTAVLVSPVMPFLPNSVSQGGGGGPAARMQQEARQNGSREPGQLFGNVRGRDIPEFSQYFGTTHAACRL